MAVALGYISSLRRLPGSMGIKNRLHTLILDVDTRAYALRKRFHGRSHKSIEIRLMYLVVAEDRDFAPIETRFRLIGEGDERQDSMHFPVFGGKQVEFMGRLLVEVA